MPLDRVADSLETKCCAIIAALDKFKFCLDYPAEFWRHSLGRPIVLATMTETEITRKQVGNLRAGSMTWKRSGVAA